MSGFNWKKDDLSGSWKLTFNSYSFIVHKLNYKGEYYLRLKTPIDTYSLVTGFQDAEEAKKHAEYCICSMIDSWVRRCPGARKIKEKG